MSHFFNDIPRMWYCSLMKKKIKEYTEYIIIHEILDFVHGMSIIRTTSFYDLMHKFNYLESMHKRHTRYLVGELGKDMINNIIDWYEHKMLSLMKEIRCGPQNVWHLKIKIPPPPQNPLKIDDDNT